MAGDIGFSIALVPSLVSKNKPSRWTCLMTALILTAFIPAVLTLKLYFAAGATILCALLWYILLIQKRR